MELDTILYPPIEPFNEFKLKVSNLHTLHIQECGNPQGIPVIFLHGGPGGGIWPNHARYFNPKKWRIVLMDQRGAGKSTPHAQLRDNTTWHLVEDVETLRKHLNIDNWVVFGGSWGSTLSLCYAIKHPKSCKALILRGIYLCRHAENQWITQNGVSWLYPDAYADFVSPIPLNERTDIIKAYYKQLTSEDKTIRQKAAKAWATFEATLLTLIPDPAIILQFAADEQAEALARLECHYFINNGFFPTDNWILENISPIQDIPGTLVQGRYDTICPMMSAWQLNLAWPASTLEIIQDAGHSISEIGISKALIKATDEFN